MPEEKKIKEALSVKEGKNNGRILVVARSGASGDAGEIRKDFDQISRTEVREAEANLEEIGEISGQETEKIHEDAERLLSASWELLREVNLFFMQIEKAGSSFPYLTKRETHNRLRTHAWALLRAANTLFSKAEALHELVEQELSGEGDA